MRIKKLMATTLAAAMVLSMAACSSQEGNNTKVDNSSSAEEGEKQTSGDTTSEAASTENDSNVVGNKNASQKLVVWTLSADLVQFAEHYCESNEDVQIENVIIAPADYPTKIASAIRGRSKEPDIIVAEPQMLETMYEAGYFEDLNQAPYNAQDYADKIVDYVWAAGQDSEGIQRAISYQITPAVVYYRRDIAQEVFNTDDPEEIGKLFADYDTILKTGQTLKDAGYKIFASDGEMNYYAGDSAWVVDGKLNVDQGRLDYMDLCVDLYQNDMTAYVDSWSATWYQAMGGSIPVIDASTSVWDAEAMEEAAKSGNTTEIFAYGLPSWGVLTMRDHVGELSGHWGICTGPGYGFGGGTYIGISTLSENKELAWDFIQFCTLNEDTADWWIQKSQGDAVSYLPALEKHKDDENEIYGGEKLYQLFLEQAEKIDYSKVTKYDDAIKNAWGAAITAIKTNQKDKETAINDFYDLIASTYPELVIER